MNADMSCNTAMGKAMTKQISEGIASIMLKNGIVYGIRIELSSLDEKGVKYA